MQLTIFQKILFTEFEKIAVAPGALCKQDDSLHGNGYIAFFD